MIWARFLGNSPLGSRSEGLGDSRETSFVEIASHTIARDGGKDPMDLSRVRELIELMDRHRLEELEVEQEGFRVRLTKQGERVREVITVPAGAAPGPVPTAPVAAEQDPAANLEGAVTSPMVGTFYRSPNPDADVFVEVGDRVEEGQVLCIIEAMKVMNEVKSERSGTIEAILVDNGESIEFGQPLFKIS